jgi:hypothetical protein
MRYIIGSALILWTYRSRRIDPLSKSLLYALVAAIVYYLP